MKEKQLNHNNCEMSKMKSACKMVLTKIPIFLFCILFINSFTGLFGKENSIAGVVVLMGVLIFIKNDFGYDVRQAAFCIPLMFGIMVIAPKLSLINPWLGIPINLIAIGLLLILSSYDLSMDNHITFLMGYIFCQGYDVTGHTFELRAAGLMIGSLLVALIYYMIRRKKTYDQKVGDLFKALDIHTIRTEWYIKLTVTLTLVMFAGDILNFPRTMWVSLAVLSLMQPIDTVRTKRGKLRLPATIIGVVLFFLVTEVLVPDEYMTIVILAAGFISMLVNSYFTKTIVNAFNAMMPAVLLFSTKDAIAIRVAATIIGTLIVVAFDALFSYGFKRIRHHRKHRQTHHLS